jgi:hypothetical protein
MTVTDVDGNASPDVVLSIDMRRAAVAWVFEWTGTSLETRTPTEPQDDETQSLFWDGELNDLTHQGPAQVFVTTEVSRPARGVAGTLYRIVNGDWTTDPQVRGLWTVGGVEGASATAILPTVAGGGPYVLRLVNGDRNGSNRLTSFSLRVDGVQILAPGVVTGSTEFYEVQLSAGTPALAIIDAVATGAPLGSDVYRAGAA